MPKRSIDVHLSHRDKENAISKNRSDNMKRVNAKRRKPIRDDEEDVGATSAAQTKFYIVESVQDYKTVDGKKMAFIKWKGYPDSESTWEPADAIFDFNQAWEPTKEHLYEVSCENELYYYTEKAGCEARLQAVSAADHDSRNGRCEGNLTSSPRTSDEESRSDSDDSDDDDTETESIASSGFGSQCSRTDAPLPLLLTIKLRKHEPQLEIVKSHYAELKTASKSESAKEPCGLDLNLLRPTVIRPPEVPTALEKALKLDFTLTMRAFTSDLHMSSSMNFYWHNPDKLEMAA